MAGPASPFLAVYQLAEDAHSLLDDVYGVPDVSRRMRGSVLAAAKVGFVVYGTVVALGSKAAYDLEAPRRDGHVVAFGTPTAALLLTVLMCLGMAASLPLSIFIDVLRRKEPPQLSEQRIPLLYEQGDDGTFQLAPGVSRPALQPPPLSQQLLWLLGPAALDVASSLLLNLGLLWVTASATQMLRASLLLFTSTALVLQRHRRLTRLHWAGLALHFAGLAAVAGAELASDAGGAALRPPRPLMALGMGMVVASQAVAAAQLLVEQALAHRVTVSPLKALGCEGLLALGMAAALVAPLQALLHRGWGDGGGKAGPAGAWDGGLRAALVHEWGDTLAQVAGSRPLQVVLGVQLLCLQGFNLCAMLVAAADVSMVSLQSLRTLFVWLLALAAPLTPLHRLAPVGEPANRWSLLQGAGLCALLLATAVYRQGDHERLRGQMEREAALVATERPPSRASSVYSSLSGRWRAALTEAGVVGILGAGCQPGAPAPAAAPRRLHFDSGSDSDPAGWSA